MTDERFEYEELLVKQTEDPENFTTQDENRLSKLKAELNEKGTKAQQELYNSLKRVEGLEELLFDNEAVAENTINFGDLAQVVGQELLDESSGNILLLYRMVLALMTVASGKVAVESGNTLNKVTDKAVGTSTKSKSTINAAQKKVEGVTMVEAISDNESEEDENEDNSFEYQATPQLAMYLSKKSLQEAGRADKEVLESFMTRAVSKHEAKEAEKVAENVEQTIEEKQEKYEELNQKQEAASEDANSTEKFTAQDKTEYQKLKQEIQTVGSAAQQELYDSLTRVEDLGSSLADNSEIANSVSEHGEFTKEIGQELITEAREDITKSHYAIFGMQAMATGQIATDHGDILDEVTDKAVEVNNASKQTTIDAQTSVTDTTQVEAIAPVQPSEGAAEGVTEGEAVEDPNATSADSVESTSTTDTPNETPEEVETPDGIPTETGSPDINDTQTPNDTPAANDVSLAPQEDVPVQVPTRAPASHPSNSNGDSSDVSDDPDKVQAQGKEALKQADGAKGGVSGNSGLMKDGASQSGNITKVAKAGAKESENKTKTAQKTEKQLAAEGDKTLNQIEKEHEKIEKLNEETLEAIAEQEKLAAEAETANAVITTASANISAAQSSQPAEGQDGDINNAIQGNVAVIEVNQSKVESISARHKALGVKINKNQGAVRKFSLSIKRRTRKYEKITKERVKMQKAAMKAEQAKQKKLQKDLAVIDTVKTAISIVQGVISVMQIIVKILEAVGISCAALSAIPIIGQAVFIPLATATNVAGQTTSRGVDLLTVIVAGCNLACDIAKAGVLFANGKNGEALQVLGTGIISAAMSFIPVGQAGGAASKAAEVLKGVSGAADVVSASANLSNNINTLQGKEQDETANTISQIAGMVSGLTGAAGGFTGGNFGKGGDAWAKLGDAAKVVGALGTVATTTSQTAAMINQAEGKEPGKFSQVMSVVGTSLSTAASVMNLTSSVGSTVQDSKKTKEERQQIKEEKQAKRQEKQEARKAEKQEKKDLKAAKKAAKENQNKETEVEPIQDEKTASERLENSIEAEAKDKLASVDPSILNPQMAQEIEQAAAPEVKEEIQVTSAEEAQEAQTVAEETENSTEDDTKDEPLTLEKYVQDTAEKNGLVAGQPKEINGSVYEISENGEYFIDGKKVDSQEFADTIRGNTELNEVEETTMVAESSAKKNHDILNEKLAAEQARALTPEDKAGIINVDTTQQNNNKKINWDKVATVAGYVSQAISTGTQIASGIAALRQEDEQQKTAYSDFDFKKARKLIKKINKKRRYREA